MASVLLVNALTVAVLIAFSIPGSVQQSITKIPVTVYYESYCPDSVRFLTKQLYPVYITPLVSYFNLTLVPYGKSTYIKNETGAYSFSCHHGAKECTGNKVHACAINLITPFEEAFKFINCVSNKIADDPKLEDFPGPQCASKLSISYVNIQQCESSMQGDELLAAYGNKTMALEPKLSSIPYVMFNEKYVEGESALATTNFKSALCAHITGTKPAECTASSSVNIEATLLLTTIALFISRFCT